MHDGALALHGHQVTTACRSGPQAVQHVPDPAATDEHVIQMRYSSILYTSAAEVSRHAPEHSLPLQMARGTLSQTGPRSRWFGHETAYGNIAFSHPCCCGDIFELAVPVVLCVIKLASVGLPGFELHLQRARQAG